MNKRKDDLKYQRLQLHEQILLRPDTYIGSVKTSITTDPVYAVAESKKIVKQNIDFNEGLVRLFIEVLSNAIDNVWRSTEYGIPVKWIKVEMNKQGFSVWNDGRNVSTADHSTEGIPIPELIFGNLLTSSNYDDTEERKTSGRNGYGVKLCNIFSTHFGLEIFNATEKVIYSQSWSNNMKSKTEPKLSMKGFPKTLDEGKNGYTKVSWTPDWKRFGMSSASNDTLAVIEKLVIDCAMTVQFNGVKVMLNGTTIDVKNVGDYINYYFDEPPSEMIQMKSSDCHVVFCASDEWSPVSFVNGIFTRDSGVHVDMWCEAVFRPILDKLNGEAKKSKITLDIRDIKKHFFVFVFASLDKPSFDNQSKTKLNSPKVSVDVKDKDIAKILKWDFVEKIKDGIKLKEMMSLKGQTERKKGKSVKVEGLEDANKAGKASEKCVLCISEGDSAAGYVLEGLQYGLLLKNGERVSGRDYIGVLPIRGKFLNVRNASVSMLVKNKEVKALIQALGLVHGVDYSLDDNFKKLRYQRLMLASDADVDGSHITGLLYNFFHTLFPSLLNVKGFFSFMRTPIVKITKGKETISFFNQLQAEEYITKNNVKKEHIKYYKGLGTSEDSEIKDDFARRLVDVVKDESADKMMENVFDKATSNYRKRWIADFVEETNWSEVKDYTTENLTVSDFLNKELIKFSIADCQRSLPSVLDGLKESQRKILYVAFKRHLNYDKKSLKVAQFGSSVAELTNYHHGENNLFDTIVKMAQRFVGSNNLPLFYNEGQFGSRWLNGSDAASPRYIFTKLDTLARLVFRPEDDQFLDNVVDDGEVVEKKYYIPVVPTVLINGCEGIGTGWSCNIPCYKLEDIVTWIKSWLVNRDGDVERVALIPWYRGFKGTIEMDQNSGKIVSTGVCEDVSTAKEYKYVVTEIPVGRTMMSINKYKEKLEELQEKGTVKSIVDHSTKEYPHFTITATEELSLEELKLVDTLSTSNMVMFDKSGKLKRYASPDEILDEFCEARFELYSIRKKGIIAEMKHDLMIMQNKARFIGEVLDDTIVLKGKDEEQLIKELEKRKYSDNCKSEELESKGKYDYLLSIQVRGMTAKKVESLQESIAKLEKSLAEYQQRTLKQLWESDLDELMKEYPKWLAMQKEAKPEGKKKVGKK